MPAVVIPRTLQPGQAIALLSPSERLNTVFEPALLRAKAVFEALGYPVKIFWTQGSSPPPTVTQSIAHRIAELVAAFSDPEVGAIICTIGGSTATIRENLPHNFLQFFGKICGAQKIFVTSDIFDNFWGDFFES
ncbi:hypothetical protein B0H19DRAFT_1253870 [Mycena capillaripes]|nr:hypothetical protein B0H19DRAFT_1253870 [Mycena capillaripes]